MGLQEGRPDVDQAADAPRPVQGVPASNGTQHSSATLSLSRPSSARLYPEWGLPEPVAAPRAFNTPELSYLQSSDTQQASDSQPGVSQGRMSEPDLQQRHQSTTDVEMLSPAQHSSDGKTLAADQTQHQRPTHALHQQPAGSAVDRQTYAKKVVKPAQPEPSNHDHPAEPSQAQLEPSGTIHLRNAALHHPDSTLPGTGTQQTADPQHPPVSSTSQQQYQQQLEQPWQRQLEQPWQQQQANPLEQLQQQQQQQDQHPESDAALSAELRQQPGAGPSNVAGVSAAHLGAYSQRELFLQNLEDTGEMSFEYVLNDGQRRNSIW